MKRRKITAYIPLSSMADIAFLLIIFFMATSVLKMDADIPLELPEGKGEELKDTDIPVHIDKDKIYYLENIPMSKNELLGRLQARILEKPESRVIVSAHNELPYEILEDLFEAFRDLNITNIAIVTKQTERKF
ncbi:MAG: biopolymer transporter ExbD [Leptospiraceae bacterium]|nr:biopolymer transporter ExbD [Leptospiraceae bacterium]MDW7977135.1 biopolymer transporter ExbD [Leptospiraceae bacterium]